MSPPPPDLPGPGLLRQLWDYWESRHPKGLLPGRQHIDPSDIPTLLPNILLVERVEGYYRYRLAGTRIAELLGREVTGRRLADIPLGESAVPWATRLDEMWQAGIPLYGAESGWKRGFTLRELHWLALPLARDGRQVDMALCGLDWT
ncbi:PAS domain-containing protein [Aerophototrophica crusticola]|uniref:PAS domain-containing protein n=1 Tax=Aerophototrophica crusticola TaxID=1709002 RepID=A0A858R764_9PROT|nr:PAS domain-containing protein [Rhodospirillaceae bacterium B3]